jgi:hypothetical protein
MRTPLSQKIKNELYARSGNQCAFPGCTENLIINNVNLSNICHIEGYEPGSMRYNPNLSNEQKNSYDNLILLCQKHHTIIDSHENKFSVECIKHMKKEHEMKIKIQSESNNIFKPLELRILPQNIEIKNFFNYYINNSEDMIAEDQLRIKIVNILNLLLPTSYDNKLLLINLLSYERNIKLFLKNCLIQWQPQPFISYIEFYQNNEILNADNFFNFMNQIVENEDGDVLLMGNNMPFKINNGYWQLDRNGKILSHIYCFLGNDAKKMNSLLNGDVLLLK